MRRGLLRSSTALVVILLVVVALALAAILYAIRAENERRRAVGAEEAAREELWKSYRDQARGGRSGLQAGHRFDSLAAIRNAARMHPSLELRNEAIACLALADLRPAASPLQIPGAPVTLDSSFERCAAADAQGRIQVRRRSNGELLEELPSLTNSVQFIFPFSPDRHFLPVTYSDGQTRLWDLQKKVVVLTFRVWSPYQTISFSPDNRRLVSAEEDGTLSIYDLAGSSAPKIIKVDFTRPWVRLSPNGEEMGVFSARTNEVWILNARSGQMLNRLMHRDVVRGLAWHPDGKLVVTGCADKNCYLWKLSQPQSPLLMLAGHQSPVVEVAFHPSGDWFISNSWDGTTRLWDTTTCQEVARLETVGNGMRFNDDGRWLAWYRTGGAASSPELMEVTTRCALRFLREPEPLVADGDPRILKISAIWEVNFNPDGRWLVSAGKQGVRVWNTMDGDEVARLTRYESHSAFFDPQGNHLIASCDEGLLRWRVQREDGGKPHFSDPERLVEHDSCERAARSEDGAVLAYGHAGKVQVLGTGRSFTGWPAAHFVTVSHDGAWVAASAWQHDTVRLWAATNGALAAELPCPGTADSKFSPDDRWLVTGGFGEYCFWDLATHQLARSLPRADTANFHGTIAFSPDGQLMALARSRTKVQLLDPKTFEELAMLESPLPQLISWLAFSPSADQLAVATETPFIQLWDLRWLRHELANLGLDWKPERALPSGTNSIAQSSHTLSVAANDTNPRSGTRGSTPARFFLVIGSAVALATCLGVLILQRQQKLVAGYLRLDELALQRARDLELAQRELAHSEKMKALGTLAAGIAHDFNNLLSVIRLSNDVISQEAGKSPSVREELESIENAVQQGRSVVRSMLGYSRQAADKPAFYAVGDVVADTVSLLSKQFLGGIVLTLDVNRAMPQVWGAPSRLEQILLNLMVNAAEAMGGHGQLTIQAQAQKSSTDNALVLRPTPAPEYVQLSVKDSGPGIAPEIRARIFEPFFTTKTVGTSPGTGLGLSTVYTIAQEDGLGLGMETAVAKGTTFRLWLPILRF
ncbi:MAG: hypothetical protein C5B50_03010 [Verrucomicrobia bacterium]|nr:MAG: hypothetical protein C5B50_03010 [Verrucomicrobiota bacterium]